MIENLPHQITSDIQEKLDNNLQLAKTWSNLTPLSKNEWICWVTFFKKPETRLEHLGRLEEELLKGKKRPCCWQGCPHRLSHPKKTYTAGHKNPI